MWDKLLQIKTTGIDIFGADRHYYPYEPTPYDVLERLANSGYIKKNDVILDYGCGKGRVDFFLSYQTRAKSIGIEYNPRIYEKAIENKKRAISSDRVEFIKESAEEYQVPTDVNRFYFFNPFSVSILNQAMARIITSYYQEPRKIILFFYYPSMEYISYLTEIDELEYVGEIDCRDLFYVNDKREKIAIFQT